MTTLIGTTVLASHDIDVLTGSNFEIDVDANLKVDDPAPSQDWASIPQGSGTGQERRAQDDPSGQQDDSFGQGTKEDDGIPTVTAGGIPNNKSDLRFFGAYLEQNASGKFLNIYWTRVQDPSGTTNMDFEFNKSTTLSSNGVTPVRTAGDVLIQYDLANGGTVPELFISRWITSGPKAQCEAANSTPCWGDRVSLSDAGDATGSINTTAIPTADADGLAPAPLTQLDPRTFGEAQIDFDALAGGSGCTGFGSAYLKSRSSDSFTAAVKDFIAPIPLNFNDCGSIRITKTYKHAANDPASGPMAGVVFTLTGNGTPANTTATTDGNGIACFDSVPINANAYTVTETVPAGYTATPSTAQTVTVNNAATCTASPYVGESLAWDNVPRTNVTVTIDSQVVGGTDSQVECNLDGDSTTPPSGTYDLDTSDVTGDGTLTTNNVLPGTYTCTIIVDP